MKAGIVLVTSTITELPVILDSFAGTPHTVQVLLPHQRLDNLDVLIIPDSGGYNLTSMGCTPHMKLPNSLYKGQDQYVEAFRIQSLEFYFKSGTILVGLGTSACLLYDDLLGGKLEFVNGRLQPISGKCLFVADYFLSSNVLGYPLASNPSWSLDLLRPALDVAVPPQIGSEFEFASV